MTQTVRTLATLQGTTFADGQGAGAITPSDLRDLIASVYGTAGTDFVWRDLIGQIDTRGTGTNDPAWTLITGSTSMWAHVFSATVMQQFWTTFHINHDWAGTPIYPHIHWFNAAAAPNTGNVVWGFEYVVAKGHNQQAFPLTATTTVYVTQACPATRYQHMIAEVALADVIPITNIEVDSLIHMRVFRDATNVADTCTDQVFGLMADCHYQASQIGTKNKAPNFNT